MLGVFSTDFFLQKGFMLEKQSLSVSLRMLCGVKSNVQYLYHVAQSYDCYDCYNSTMVALSFLMKGFIFLYDKYTTR